MDQNAIFTNLMSLLGEVDQAFSQMNQQFPDEICCKPGCDDCCHACFNVSLAEALLLKEALQSLPEHQLANIVKRAQATKEDFDSLSAKLQASGDDPASIMSLSRLRCPFLREDKTCEMYEVRPVTCRAYGLPTSIHGQGHVCGFSGFDKGKDYPTIKLDSIHLYLSDLSAKTSLCLGFDSEQSEKRYFIHEIVLEEIV